MGTIKSLFQIITAYILPVVLLLNPSTLNATQNLKKTHNKNLNLILSSQINKASGPELKKIAYSKPWIRLLYYKKNWFGNFKSEVNNPNFFISKIGHKSPIAELKESFSVFFSIDKSEGITDEHPICKFPARFFWLNKKLKLNELNKLSQCTKLNEFLARIRGQSVSLVFSSYYVSNPSSAFGHTFLKVNKDDNSELDLLNYGINYAATSTENFGLIYAFKGLFGFFTGNFTAIPYYYKVREYNDYESRDLWEYQLNLTSQDVFFLNLHIWELGKASSWYYFLNKNCSYWAVRVLEAIKPDLNLEKYFKSHFVVPIETVKSLFKTTNLIKDIKYRPSLRQQLVKRLMIDSESKNKFGIKKMSDVVDKLNTNTIAENELTSFSIDDLKTTLLLYDYKNAGDYVDNEAKLLKNKQPLLIAISQKDGSGTETKTIPEVTPHNSHPPRRLSLGYQTQALKNTVNNRGLSLSYKQGLHDIIDSSRGFSPFMSLNYFDFSFLLYDQKSNGSYNEQKLQLDYFKLIGIDAFMPINDLEKKYSWRLNVGYDSEQLLNTWTKKTGYINFDIGLSKLILKNKKLLIYGLLSNIAEFNGRYSNSARLTTGPTFGFKFRMNEDLNLIFENSSLWASSFNDQAKFVNHSKLRFQNYFENLNSAISIDTNYIKSNQMEVFNFSTYFSYFY